MTCEALRQVACILAAAKEAVLGLPRTGAFWAGVAAVGLPLAVRWLSPSRRRRFRLTSQTVSLPFGLGSRTYELSLEDRTTAWKMYVQLATRKAALPFDDKHDVVAEVHSSLYELFGVARDLLSALRVEEMARRGGVAELILSTLNDGLRPYLTRWQASFKRWWDEEEKNGANRLAAPQELQRGFPGYDELLADLKRTNTELSRLADELLRIAQAARPEAERALPRPQPPGAASAEPGGQPPSEVPATEPPPKSPYVPQEAGAGEPTGQEMEP